MAKSSSGTSRVIHGRGANVVLIIPFKACCALLFPKGALLKDARGLLVKAGENTQAARQMRFTSLAMVNETKSTLKAYLREAIAVQKAGLEVEFKAIAEIRYPEELQSKLDENAALKAAFEALTPGRRRAYAMHFAAPKQAATRLSRIEKCLPQILGGKGLNEDYRTKKKGSAATAD